MLKRLLVCVSVGIVGIGIGVAPAGADIIPPHAAPAYEGSVRISTVADGFVDIQINGRGLGWSTNQHRPQYCQVLVGQTGQLIRLDAFGNGSGRIGPFKNGSYTVNGRCVDDYHMTGSNLLNNSISIIIDGNPTAATPGGSTPIPEGRAPVTQTLNQYCNSTADALTAVGLAGFLFTPAVGAVTSTAALAASTTIRAVCIDAANQIGDRATAVEQGCRALEDIVYGWIEDHLKGFPLQQFLPPSCGTV
ncbi:hypothetical protein [Nocardia fluminea]|uniref:hypothetical protein n=1 Tax=Nocardia fluminea TaxID=134984 RepID=UPI00365C0416